jgi:hypothetical protein
MKQVEPSIACIGCRVGIDAYFFQRELPPLLRRTVGSYAIEHDAAGYVTARLITQKLADLDGNIENDYGFGLLDMLWDSAEVCMSESAERQLIGQSLINILEMVPAKHLPLVSRYFLMRRREQPSIGQEPDLSVLSRLNGIASYTPDYESPVNTQRINALREAREQTELQMRIEAQKAQMNDEFTYFAGAVASHDLIML